MIKEEYLIKKITVITNIVLAPFFTNSLKDRWPDALVEYVRPDEVLGGEGKNNKSEIVIIWLDYISLLSDYLRELLFVQRNVNEVTDILLNKIGNIVENVSKVKKNTLIYFITLFDNFDQMHHISGSVISALDIVEILNIRIFETYSNKCTMIKLANIVAEIGLDNAISNQNRYRWDNPYRPELYELIACEVDKQQKIAHSLSPKCIVLDCDGVLWGGTVIEDGINCIHLSDMGKGKRYKDFQRFVLRLYGMGVIIAICSKNDEEKVKEIFEYHSDMVLKLHHISCFKVNWLDKPSNIRSIAEELNISLDSIVFVDDNLYEVQAVQESISAVKCVHFSTKKIYECLSCFNLSCDFDKDTVKARQETYQYNVKRKRIRAKYKTEEEYIESLDIKIDIHIANEIEYFRLSELSLRANKCSNGRRYKYVELCQKVKEKEYYLYSIVVSDMFGDLGIVGAVGVIDDNLDLFCFSCRAMGRKIEEYIIDYLLKEHRLSHFEFASTGKNEKLYLILKEKIYS